MVKKIKSICLLLICLCIVVSSFSLPVSANSGYRPTEYRATYYTASKISTPSRGEKALTFTATVNGSKQVFTLAFPSLGGIRFSTQTTGFFEVNDYSKLTYKDIKTGVTEITAENGQKAELVTENGAFRLILYSAEGNEVFSLGSEQIQFGYAYGKFQKVKLVNTLSEKEVIYGFGGRHTGLNQVGKIFKLWNNDGYGKEKDAEFEGTYSYANAPVFNSTKGYTVYFNSSYSAVCDIGKTDPSLYSLDFNGPIFDLFVWTDTQTKNMESYTSLTGRPVDCPEWALGYWAGHQANYWNSEGTDRYNILLESTLEQYKNMGTIPAALYGEGNIWGDPESYEITDKYGTRMLSWHYPDMNPYSESNKKLWENIAESDYAVIKDILNPFRERLGWADDYSNPSSITVLKRKYQDLLKTGKYGLSGAMIDYGEYIPQDGVFYNGKTGDEMHNLWAYYYARAVNTAWTEAKGSKDFILFERPAYSGSQAYAGNFTGDQGSTWDGMEEQIYYILSMAASGFNLVGGDIGGFSGRPTTEMYMRWLQFGTFSPLMRAHGTQIRDPWGYGARAESVFKEHYWIRENIDKLLYSSMLKANKSGNMMVKSLPVIYPELAHLKEGEMQYLFCDNLLVCPVTVEGEVLKEAVIPKGDWYSLWTAEKITGNDEVIKVDAPTTALPVYIKSGAVIPVTLSQNLKMADQIKDGKKVNGILVTPPEKEEAVVYYGENDAGTAYATTPLDKGVFKITAKQADNTEAVLVYGQNANGITVDGEKLEMISAEEKGKKVGYYHDGANITVISLPKSAWKEITVSGKYSENIAEGAFAYNASGKEMAALTDGKNNKMVTINNKVGTVMLDLGAPKSINQVTIKWGAGYSDKHQIMGSYDGEEWIELANIKNADGGIEQIKFDTQNLRYLSIGNIKKAAGVKMSIYEICVFGEDGAANGTSGGFGAFISNNLLIIIIVAVAVVLAVAAAVVLLIIKKRKKA